MKIGFLDEAEAELRAEITRYDNERPGLGDEFWGEVQQALGMIEEYPQIGGVIRRPRVRGTARRVPLRRFPYYVVYREREDLLEIVAIAHQSRRPGYWRSRGV